MAIEELVGMKRVFGYSSNLLDITATDSALYGKQVKIYKGSSVVATGVFSSSGYVQIPTTACGEVKIECTVNSTTVSAKLEMPFYATYYVKLGLFTYKYGFTVNPMESDPDAAITALSDCDNNGYSKAYMDFINGSFVWGSWENAPFLPKPCMLKYDGTVDYYLMPGDYTTKATGGSSDVANTAYDGNAMMEFPKIYISAKETSDGKFEYRISDVAIDDTYKCYSNINMNGDEVDNFYCSIYPASLVNGKHRSLSGRSPSVNLVAQTEINYWTANGDGWYTELLCDRMTIQTLILLMTGSFSSQTKLGYGWANTSAARASGQCDKRGLFYGTSGNGDLKILGMEHWYGNVWRRIAGWINANGTQKIKLTYGTQDGSTATAYNLTGDGYITVEGATPQGSSGGYISGYKLKNGVLVPYRASGSASTYMCDGLWYNNGQVDVALVGGYWSSSALVGAFTARLGSAASYAGTDVGCGGSYKPLKKKG